MMIGNFNPCDRMILLDESGRILGYCLDTPNSFACACIQSCKIVKGVVHDKMFGDSYRVAALPDTQDRIRMLKSDKVLCEKLKESVKLNECER